MEIGAIQPQRLLHQETYHILISIVENKVICVISASSLKCNARLPIAISWTPKSINTTNPCLMTPMCNNLFKKSYLPLLQPSPQSLANLYVSQKRWKHITRIYLRWKQSIKLCKDWLLKDQAKRKPCEPGGCSYGYIFKSFFCSFDWWDGHWGSGYRITSSTLWIT